MEENFIKLLFWACVSYSTKLWRKYQNKKKLLRYLLSGADAKQLYENKKNMFYKYQISKLAFTSNINILTVKNKQTKKVFIYIFHFWEKCKRNSHI